MPVRVTDARPVPPGAVLLGAVRQLPDGGSASTGAYGGRAPEQATAGPSYTADEVTAAARSLGVVIDRATAERLARSGRAAATRWLRDIQARQRGGVRVGAVAPPGARPPGYVEGPPRPTGPGPIPADVRAKAIEQAQKVARLLCLDVGRVEAAVNRRLDEAEGTRWHDGFGLAIPLMQAFKVDMGVPDEAMNTAGELVRAGMTIKDYEAARAENGSTAFPEVSAYFRERQAACESPTPAGESSTAGGLSLGSPVVLGGLALVALLALKR